MDIVVDSGRSFRIRSITGIKSEGQVDGGRTASGGTIPILGIRSLRVGFVETIRGFTTNVKEIQGFSKAFVAVSEKTT